MKKTASFDKSVESPPTTSKSVSRSQKSLSTQKSLQSQERKILYCNIILKLIRIGGYQRVGIVYNNKNNLWWLFKL